MADARFWNNAAKKYAASPIKDIEAYDDTLQRTRSFLNDEDHLLEIGCGTGGTAIALANSVRQVTATDVSTQMLAFANEKREKADVKNVSFIDAEALTPLPAAPFDAICAFSILHLVDDLPRALAHLFDQIKPGGYVISKTACLREMNILIIPMIKLMKAVGKAPNVIIFSAAELEAAFRMAGFEIIETAYFGKNKYTRFVVARRPK